jgi:putative transposase
LRCLIYIDLNMVRVGVVGHPSKWSHGGHNEIQFPRRKNIIIACDRLHRLAGFKDYESFASAHRKWVQDSIDKNDSKRDGRWSGSIMVDFRYLLESV